MSDRVAYTDVLAKYAAALERSVDTLTPLEKRTALGNAILSGIQVEPFATWNDWGDAALSVYGSGAETLNQFVRRLTASRTG